MKLTDAIISAVIKRGIVYEARNTNVDIPVKGPEGDPLKIRVSIEHMTVRLEKAPKGEE